MESLKTKSRIVTLIVTVIFALLTYVSTMSPETLAAYLPSQYAGYATVIVIIVGAIVNQYSEEKRVERAEELTIRKSAQVLGTPMDGGVVLNEEHTSPNDLENIEFSDDGC